jgi:hypothetical protein
MHFLLPTAKAIITIDLEYLCFSSFARLTNDQGIRFAINVMTISHLHTAFIIEEEELLASAAAYWYTYFIWMHTSYNF